MTNNPAKPAPLIILTRPLADSTRFAEELRQNIDADILIHPLQKIVIGPRPDVVDCDYGALIFTSVQGVRAAQEWGFSPKIAFAVGRKTAAAAKHITDICHTAHGNSDDLVKLIINHPPKGRLLHMHGTHVAGSIATDLAAAGIECDTATAYDQVALPAGTDLRHALGGERCCVIPVFSPRSATLLLDVGGNIGNWHIIAMSHKVAEIFPDNQVKNITIAARPDGPAMLDAVCKVYRELMN